MGKSEIVAERSYTKAEVDEIIIRALRSQDTTPIHIHTCTEGLHVDVL